MHTIHGIATGDVADHVVQVRMHFGQQRVNAGVFAILGLWILGIAIDIKPPKRRTGVVKRVATVDRCRRISPDRHRVDPGVELQAIGVGGIDSRFQRIPPTNKPLGAGLEIAVVIGVALAAHLKQHVGDSHRRGVLHDLLNAGWIRATVLEARDPHRAKVGELLGLGLVACEHD
eukprot:Plantae.Rhodophyta-Hildenbrandia_rubra.ctg32359.p2 GENE.Plantae.Rhodophyta-Hildenbrandia_rubra.ctg32359~~Plantae.Rhodophyta-Hildenbrandia_rubra.ctg32359.p2  ORF type:complete len:174 (+),score=7.83 Plantae.Rhodophyta-Hildenbrandia_rubra.ctg32359:654-1175(+)